MRNGAERNEAACAASRLRERRKPVQEEADEGSRLAVSPDLGVAKVLSDRDGLTEPAGEPNTGSGWTNGG